MAKSKTVGRSKTKTPPSAKRTVKKVESSNGAPPVAETAKVTEPDNVKPRLLPTKSELKSLYERYTENSTFDDHDKAFYFALDVGGISRAKQLLAHVEEVLAEMEELQH